MAQTCRLIEHDAKVGAPVRKPRRGEPAGGRLRAEIHTELRIRGEYNVTGRVGASVRYAEVAHNGARRHRILPRNKRMLSFYWDNAPRRMVTRSGPYKGKVLLRAVMHPGMKGRRYLTVPLRFWGRERGFKVVTNL